MEFINKYRKQIIIGLAVIVGLLSFFVFGNKYSDPEAYNKLIAVLDDKKANVMGLTASTSAASIAITLIPDDIGTPIATQLASLSGYLLLILTVIYLEKYLLTVIGFAVFKVIIPIACILFIIYELRSKNNTFLKAASRIAIFGVVLMLLIPTSITVSNMIDKTYQESISQTLDVQSEEIVVEEESSSTTQEPKQDLKWYEKIFNKFEDTVEDVKNSVSSSSSEAINKAKNMLSNFIEATAVMIVTSCIIPILTVIIFIWLAKIILGIDLSKTKYIELIHKDKEQACQKQDKN